MLPTLLLLALVASVSCGKGSIPDLEWPEKYSFEISRYNIASGLVEDIKIWKSNKSVRVEYNHGAVKTIVTSEGRRGTIYEIHPETDKNGSNTVVCHELRRYRWTPLPENINVLPDTDDFKSVGEELMKSMKCTKFYKEETEDNIESKKTIWAYYDQSITAWIPVRYQLEQSNTFLGYVDRRDLWEIESYSGDFDEKKVFDASEFGCESDSAVQHDIHDESVTKHLMFVNPDNEHHVNHVFQTFKNKFQKKYAHEKEHNMRKKIFQHNLRLISSTNRQNRGYKLAVNHLSDRTPRELKRYTGLLPRPRGKVGTHRFPYRKEEIEEAASKVPSKYDLRLEGIISPIQNQESCGSCWTFGTTSALEGALARHNAGKLIRLSNQALIDCGWEFGVHGCDGGTDNGAYEWMMKYGMPTIEEYGIYENQDGYCHIENVTKTFKIRGYVDVTPSSINALKVALFNHGPLSVSVHATEAFVSYSSGVFYDFNCDPTQLNHEITLVGYGEELGETFWIVKNSWGPEWGIDGYMHIAAKDNNCGIMSEPTYVLL